MKFNHTNDGQDYNFPEYEIIDSVVSKRQGTEPPVEDQLAIASMAYKFAAQSAERSHYRLVGKCTRDVMRNLGELKDAGDESGFGAIASSAVEMRVEVLEGRIEKAKQQNMVDTYAEAMIPFLKFERDILTNSKGRPQLLKDHIDVVFSCVVNPDQETEKLREQFTELMEKIDKHSKENQEAYWATLK